MNSAARPEARLPDGRLPRYQQLRDDLVQRIAAGEWAPGQAIQTEAELSSHYQVSTGLLKNLNRMMIYRWCIII